MTAHVDELLTELNRRGIRLKADGDRLRFHPKSLVTADLLARMRACKGELLAALAEPGDSGVTDSRTLDHGVPDGWTRERWAARLEYMASICIVPARAAELREWRAKVLSEGVAKRV